MTPNEQRIVGELDKLIELAERLGGALIKSNGYGFHFVDDSDRASYEELLVRSRSLAARTFGEASVEYANIAELKASIGVTKAHLAKYRGRLVGLRGIVVDGHLRRLRASMSGEVWDSVLQEAKYLLDQGHKDPAAMLGRVALENAIKLICEDAGIEVERKKASALNDLLKDDRYPQQVWRNNRARLDLGNNAAHGDFDKYSSEDVRQMLGYIENFIIQYVLTIS